MSAAPQESKPATAVVEYSATEAALNDLRGRYQGVVFDVRTKEGLQAAVKGRAELRTLRTALEAKRKELKAPVIERGKLLDSEAARITMELAALEDPIDAQIKAEEERKAREKAEAEERERKRIAAIHDRIAQLAQIPTAMIGKTATIIDEEQQRVKAIEITEADYGEFIATAREAHAKTVSALALLHGGALAKERQDTEDRERAEREKAELKRLREEEAKRIAEARTKAEEEAKARAQQEAADRAEREKHEAMVREQQERDMAERRAKIEAEEKAAAESRARAQEEERAARAEREKAEQARREAERLRDELADGDNILRNFLTRFDGKREFATVCTAIRKHFEKKAS